MGRTITLDQREGKKHTLYVLLVDGSDNRTGNGFYGKEDGLETLEKLQGTLGLTREEIEQGQQAVQDLPSSPFRNKTKATHNLLREGTP